MPLAVRYQCPSSMLTIAEPSSRAVASSEAITSSSCGEEIGEAGQAGPISSTTESPVTAALQASFASAAHVAQAYPADAGQILAAARESLAAGAWAAYLVGAIVLVAGALVVRFGIPDRRGEARLHERYRADDERMPQPGA